MKKTVRLAGVLLPLTLLAACGSDAKTEPSADTTKAPAETTAPPAETTASPAETTAPPAETTAPPAETTAPPAAGGDAAAAVEAARVDPTGIGVTIPLTGKPEKKKVVWIEGAEAASAKAIAPGLKGGAEALGWDLVTISTPAATPEPAFAQALQEGANYIVISGTPQALYPEGLKAAKAAGVPILSLYSTEDPSIESGVPVQFGDESLVIKSGSLMANWTVVDSGGKANVMLVSISLYPVLVAETDAYQAEMKKNCADCTTQLLDVTLDDLIKGKIPGLIGDKLTADPSINYVYFSFGDLPGGVSASLKELGLDKQVKLIGQDFNSADLQEIIDGTHAVWSGQPKAYAGWLAIDAAARLSLGMELTEERAAAALPIVLVEDAAKAKKILEAGGDWIPEGAADAFKKLWGVG